jgi:hypothetical protein
MPTVCNYGQNIVGPFKQTLFLGCSVKSFSCTIGWNEQATTLTVELVEDPCAGPKVYYNRPGHEGTHTGPDPGFEAYQPTVGGPVYFRVADFEFAGVVQSWNRTDSTTGLKQYSISISDPRFILQNTQVILNENNGSVGGLFNIINVFGFLEAHGFGSSDVNDQGIPWFLVKLAASTLLSGAMEPTFGPHGAIAFRSHDWNGTNILGGKFGLVGSSSSDSYDGSFKTTFGGNGWYTPYFLDMEDIPFAPAHYRFGADSMTVMDIISQVCDDAGCDYYIEMFLTGQGQKVIKVRTQARRAQPVMGKIQEFIDTRDNIISKNIGRELRNEPTSSFATGANLQTFYTTDIYDPWWGLDEDGVPIVWRTTTTNIPDDYLPATYLNGKIYDVYMDFRKLNTTLSTPLGVNKAWVNELEMRAALKGVDDWTAYALSYNNGVGTVTGKWLLDRGHDLFFAMQENLQQDVNAGGANNGPGNFPGGGGFNFNVPGNAANIESDKVKLHAFIQSFANEYYGKKILVNTDAQRYYNTEAQKDYYSKIPAGEAWIDDGSSWLGITKPNVYLDPFTSDTGMIAGGCGFDADYGFVKGGDVVSDTTYLYVRSQAASEFVTGVKTVVTLSTEVELKVQETGDADDYAGWILVGRNNNRLIADLRAEMDEGFNFGAANVAFGLNKRRLYPLQVEVPMRSNYTKYGPFPYQGPPGPVNLKPNDDLSPWSYGDAGTMTLVANAQSQEGLTFMQEGERGSINWPGYPEHRIGAELRSSEPNFISYNLTQFQWHIGLSSYYYLYLPITSATGLLGPNITSIAVNVSDGGVNTSYELTTFTPNFGRLAKINTERLKQAAKNRVAQAKQRRKMAFMDMYVQRSRFLNNRGS